MERQQMTHAWSNDQLLDLATRMAQAAGTLIAEALHRPRTLDVKSSATDLVTEMDRAAEDLIVGMIDAERPGDGILGEEGTSRPSTTGVRWVIDPIDGTTNYVYRHPFFSVSIGCERDGQTVAGAVSVPMLGELYTGVLGGGAFRNGEPIRVSNETDLHRALVGVGFGYKPEYRAVQGARAAALISRIREIRRGGSAAIDLCFVADGRLDAYYEDGLNPWDESAGLLIASEAGAAFVKELLRNGPGGRPVLIIGTPGIHQALLDELRLVG
jgi:myo-inositol-1(or 4)-monophosphatase